MSDTSPWDLILDVAEGLEEGDEGGWSLLARARLITYHE